MQSITWQYLGAIFLRDRSEVIDGQVVTAGVSVTWNTLSWYGGHEFGPQLGRTWGSISA